MAVAEIVAALRDIVATEHGPARYAKLKALCETTAPVTIMNCVERLV